MMRKLRKEAMLKTYFNVNLNLRKVIQKIRKSSLSPFDEK